MRTKEVMDLCKFSAETLRYYERIKLIEAKRDKNGYRSYDEQDVEKLLVIGKLKSLNFTLEEIGDLFRIEAIIESKEEHAGELEQVQSLVEHKLADLNALKLNLEESIMMLSNMSGKLTRVLKGEVDDRDYR